ncbi:MAG: hypothetical protein ABI778_04380 [Ignavibacteriota bacterium]
MRLSQSQQELLDKAYAKLRRRDIVFFNGSANGKTQILDMLRWRASSRAGGKLLGKSATDEKITLQILEDIQRLPRTDKLTSTAIMRLVLKSYGLPAYHSDIVDVERRYREHVMELQRANIMPVLALDNIEIFPKRAYTVLKELNEYRYHGKKLGIAIALCGDLVRSKMTMPFYEKTSEIAVDKSDSVSELRDILAMWFPLDLGIFSPVVMQSFKRCESLQQIIKAANIMVDKWHDVKVSDDEEVTEEMAMNAVSKAKRLVKLAA